MHICVLDIYIIVVRVRVAKLVVVQVLVFECKLVCCSVSWAAGQLPQAC